jgi:diaminopimelate epimerase
MHGLGNDFVVIDARRGGRRVTPDCARAIGDRHRGVGFDQLAEILPAKAGAEAGIAFWNSDGSQAQACGNATRCVADLLMRESGRDSLTLSGPAGPLAARRRPDGLVEVNMGPPQLDWQAIPLSEPADPLALPIPGDPAAVGMGNPHCVFFVPELGAAPVETLGPQIERHPLFPERTNVEFVQVLAPDHLRLRVWERGAGVTLACGSGACAAAVAAHRRGLAGARMTVTLDGGDLEIALAPDGVLMAGPVAYVFEGALDPAFLAAAEAPA